MVFFFTYNGYIPEMKAKSGSTVTGIKLTGVMTGRGSSTGGFPRRYWTGRDDDNITKIICEYIVGSGTISLSGGWLGTYKRSGPTSRTEGQITVIYEGETLVYNQASSDKVNLPLPYSGDGDFKVLNSEEWL